MADRRTVVADRQLQQCHVSLQLHGTLRNNTEYCVMCHNPSNTDASTRASAVVASDKAAPPQGINFNLLVHRIHYGINMQAANRTYIVVGYGGSHNDFSSTLFPALSPTGAATDTQNCSLCHVNGSEQNTPPRNEPGHRSAGSGQSEPGHFLGLFRLPCGSPGRVAHAFKHHVARRSMHGLPQLRCRLCRRSGPCAVLICAY